ncbi:MAG: hypothetical protein FWE95_02640 [Planctomycetaceae bacterium]|nr:hypothetical protein [Planctomycetaceae bacterium]
MRNVSDVIVAVNKTVGELEATVSHFKSNPGGTVMLAGHTYPGFIPVRGVSQLVSKQHAGARAAGVSPPVSCRGSPLVHHRAMPPALAR